MMKSPIVCTLFFSVLLLACGRREERAEPRTPQEMYSLVLELLQPNIEHSASETQEALLWLQRAADGGLVQAQTDLAGIYLEGGAGVKRDTQVAYSWFKRAAEQGSAEAGFFLGYILYNGLDMPRRHDEALKHWHKAANGGVSEAWYYLGRDRLLTSGSAREGADWLRRAAEGNVPKIAAQAACLLGDLYAKGKGDVEQDLAEAGKWYAQGAQAGDARAQYIFAMILMQGHPTSESKEMGMRFLRLSAGQDNMDAIAMLIKCLKNKEYSSSEQEEIVAWSQRLEKLLENKKQAKSNL